MSRAWPTTSRRVDVRAVHGSTSATTPSQSDSELPRASTTTSAAVPRASVSQSVNSFDRLCVVATSNKVSCEPAIRLCPLFHVAWNVCPTVVHHGTIYNDRDVLKIVRHDYEVVTTALSWLYKRD